MADSAQIGEDFFDAWTSKDFDRARALLHDDVSFAGPIDTFDSADAYIGSLRQLSGIVTGAEKQRVFVDGDDACVIYDLKTAPVPSSRTCEWYRVRDGKIEARSVLSPDGPCGVPGGVEPTGLPGGNQPAGHRDQVGWDPGSVRRL
jgi:ketosteroid isomerase-like protein